MTDLSLAQMYAISYFASMIGIIFFLSIILGFVYLIINLYNKLMKSIFGKEEEQDYD